MRFCAPFALRRPQYGTRPFRVISVVALLMCFSTGCASLEGLRALVQPPRFEQADEQRSEIRLNGAAGASVRIWTRVSNPNRFGLTLSTLSGALYLEGAQAATVNLPLGLPLAANGERVVPIDVSVEFRDVPGLGEVIARAIARQPIEYELEGTVGVSAGRLGEPTFGPMTVLRGELR